jgi:biopolymer transport protein ExbD
MGRIKVPRKSTAVDMTAMCDVAFLLLTFFILTATSRQPDPLDITTPSSTVQFKVPDKDLAILSIGKKGKVFIEIIGQDVKKLTLQKMAGLYGATFTEEQAKRFGVLSSFGVQFNQLGNYINMSGEQRTKSGLETGIPTDSTRNGELYRWVEQARRATAELHNTEMRISIKGDANEEYPAIRKIVDVLQKQSVNKFSLITSAEAAQ